MAIPGVDCDLIADVIQGEVPRAPQGDLAKLAAAATPPHHLVHPMHRRGEDLRDLVDGRRGRVRETHHGRRIAAGDPVEDLGGQVVDLPMDDMIDSELLLHPVAAIEMPSAGSAEDDLILPIRPLQPPDEVEKHRLRVRRQDPAHREGHADRPEAERVHRVQAHDLRIVVDELFHVTRVRDDDGLTAVRLDQGRFDFPKAIWHPGRPTLPIDLGRAR